LDNHTWKDKGDILTQKKLLDYGESKDSIHQNIKKIDIISTDYPYLLRHIRDPPKILYALGNIKLLNEPSIAIVGTRKPSQKGKEYAKIIAEFYSKKGFVIVSGLAQGIDTLAIKTTLNNGGKVICVIPSLRNITPKKNVELANDILKDNGLLISESLDERIKKYQFVKRNRIISGLSFCVVVVESNIRGGTMHTVEYAKKQRRLIIVADLDAIGNESLKKEGFPVFRIH